ncbi:MAG TPA: manganese efflux pump MntP family protein [Clostridia bacterium]
MIYLTVVLIGISLSMDAAAAAAASGACSCCKKGVLGLKCASLFAVFQGAMTLAGYLLGALFIEYVSIIDHWIAFGLLGFIGGKMIIDAFSNDDQKVIDYSSNKVLLILAVATSIDAFAVGMGLTVENLNIYISSLIIALVTFVICLISSKIGNRLGEKFEKRALIIGGILLIAIGLKILIEHIFFA